MGRLTFYIKEFETEDFYSYVQPDLGPNCQQMTLVGIEITECINP